MVQGDLRGSLLQEIENNINNIDAIIIDLIDERGGVMAYPNGGIFTPHAKHAKAATKTWSDMGTAYWNLGTQSFFDAFQGSAQRFAAFLKEHGLLQKTVVLDIPYALRYHQGDPKIDKDLFDRQMTTAIPTNENMMKLYAIMDSAGFKAAGLRDRIPFMDGAHVWGQAPFHYSLDDYQAMESAVLSALD